ncbi:MAG TPA: hypothetical protein VND66_14895 [Acidobacteriaceae bacterium]|nr:hypothetical protein [Acidobacteriaceae bacterium]
MTSCGYDPPEYVLFSDSGGSFETGMSGWHGAFTPEQTAQFAAEKQVFDDGFKATLTAGLDQDKVGLLVDEQFVVVVLHAAANRGHGHTQSTPAPLMNRVAHPFGIGSWIRERAQ